jgi:hypothetical protein
MTGTAEFAQCRDGYPETLFAVSGREARDKTAGHKADMQVAVNSKGRCHYVSRWLFSCSIGSVAVPPVSCSFPTCTTLCILPVQCLVRKQKMLCYIRRRRTESSPHITLNPSFEYQAPADLLATSSVCRAPTT